MLHVHKCNEYLSKFSTICVYYSEWGDWEEPPSSSTHCLFCQNPSQDFQESLHHMKTCHGFDFTQASTDQCLDFYSQVKAVNYIRKQVCIDGVENVYDHNIKLLDA